MAEQATFRGTKEDLKARLREIPAILSGRVADPTGAVSTLLKALGVEALSIVKSGLPEVGRWSPFGAVP
jgi:hypothetical protein